MKPFIEMVFIGELVRQAKFAEIAANRLQKNTDNFDELEIWGAIQSILAAAGNASKILWPARRSSLKRGKRLRDALGIKDENPLSDRNIRNHFEHYDERIEDWLKEIQSSVYTDSVIDPFPPIWGRAFSNRHREYNPVTQIVIFRGESVDLANLLSALDELLEKCRPYVLV